MERFWFMVGSFKIFIGDGLGAECRPGLVFARGVADSNHLAWPVHVRSIFLALGWLRGKRYVQSCMRFDWAIEFQGRERGWEYELGR